MTRRDGDDRTVGRADHDDAALAAPPPRLMDEEADAGALLRAAARAYARGLDEKASWARFAAATLAGTRPRGRARWATRLAIPLALAAAAALALAGRLTPRRAPAPQLATRAPAAAPAVEPEVVPLPRVVPPEPPAEQPREAAAAPPRHVTPTGHPHPLTAGATLLADGTSIRLAPRAVAAVSAAGRADRAITTVALASGAIELEVAPQDAGRHFQVEGGRYRFQVAGARFRLVRGDARAELEVHEGTVAVLSGDRVVARVRRGQRWEGRLLAGFDAGRGSLARAAAPAAAEQPVARAPDGPDCLAPARDGRPRQAVDCFSRVAEGRDLSAERAFLEIARLQQDKLSDPAGAVATLERYRARFPKGFLQTDAGFSLLDLLPKLGRHREALAESDRLLRTGERAHEVRLVRGNIYREILRDYGGAEAEYALAARDRGATGDEAAFLRGVCLEAEGKKDQAQAAFREYLQRAGARKTAEARRHLDALERRGETP